MTEVPIIPPIKIDLGIKIRKKGVNKRHQFYNPFGEDNSKFELPKGCDVHSNNRFQCATLNTEDIADFRTRLFQTTEKSDQNTFLQNFITTLSPKRRTGRAEVARVMQVYYKLQRKWGEAVPVCREMFFTVTGLGQTRVANIVKKVYKKELIERGDNEVLNLGKKKEKKTAEKQEKMKKILNDKKERILKLEKGSFEIFSKALHGHLGTEVKQEEKEDEKPEKPKILFGISPSTSSSKTTKKKRTKQYKTKTRKIKQESEEEEEDGNNYSDYERIPEAMSEDEEIVVLNRIDLDLFECCRICLRNDCKLLSFYKKHKYESHTNAELIEYALGIHVTPEDNLPQKICESCLERVKIACKLKSECLESQEIIETCVEETKYFEATDNSFDPHILLHTDYDDIMEEDIVYHDEHKISDDEVFRSTIKEPPQQRSRADAYANMRPKKCFLCNIDFENSPEEHFKEAHSLIAQTRCNMCEFETEFPWYLNLHYQIHADDVKLCDYCGKMFKRGSYHSHERYCVRNKETLERFPCRYCPATYLRAYYRTVHERIHTHEKPYKCDHCQAAFTKRIPLRRHLLTHGVGSAFHCDGCGKAYVQKYELSRHQTHCFRKNL